VDDQYALKQLRQYQQDAEGTIGLVTPEGWTLYKDESSLWLPGCDCDLGSTPCRVLDPFGGAATTLLAAAKLGRSVTAIELNPEYALQGAARVREKSGYEVQIPILGETDEAMTTIVNYRSK
jgi:hypothetical protein